MVNKQNLWNNTEVNKPSVKGLEQACALPCKIVGVTYKEDNDLLEIRFDIAEGNNKGLFAKCTQEKQNGKWWYQGQLGISCKDEHMSSFKAAITSVEESNPNYHWDWNEKSLINRFVVVCFGEVESQMNDGKIITLIKPRWFRSLKAFREGSIEIPKKKALANNSTMPQANYGYQVSQDASPQYSANIEVNDNDLPF